MARRSAPDRMLRLALVASFGLGVALPAATFANGTLKPHDGCAVVLAVDGDTVKLLCPGEGLVPARLTGFDTPEIFSPRCASELARGIVATASLDRLLFSAGHIAVSGEGTDRYGRRLVRLDLDGQDVANRMIASGLARPYAGGRRQGWCG